MEQEQRGEKTMRKPTTWLKVMVGVLLALALLPAALAQGNAKVRVVHASPDAPAVDVYVDGSKVLTNVPFFTASDYLDLPAGEHRFQVTPTGQPADKAVIDAKATVEAGKAYTVAATGKVAEIKPTILAARCPGGRYQGQGWPNPDRQPGLPEGQRLQPGRCRHVRPDGKCGGH
jgi:hypothetical protein